MRILITLITSLCLALPAYADLSINDLPYLEGTPLEPSDSQNPSWTLLDFAEEDGVLAWAWLEKTGSLAYVVYPSSSSDVVFPDGTSVAAEPNNIVLRFLGDADQRLEFFRFGGAAFILTGSHIEVRYNLREGYYPGGVYVGDISVEAETIEIDLSAEIDGDLALLAHDHLGVYGFIDLSDNQLSAYANSNVITGTILHADGVLNNCETDFAALPPSINIGAPNGQKFCYGDFVNTTPQIQEPMVKSQSVSASGSSKGGSTGGMIWGLVALLALFRRRNCLGLSA